MGIDKTLLEKSDIYPGEIIQVVNVNNGSRFETYAVAERAGSGKIALYGAAARLGKVGDLVIIFAYGLVENRKSGKVRLKVVRVDPKNNPL
jgi:aspartate 1-decarboxylase